MSNLKQWSKAVAVTVSIVALWLAVSWLTTTPPRDVWFHQETVTVTRTVAPWWMHGIEMFPIIFLVILVWIMMSVGPREVR